MTSSTRFFTTAGVEVPAVTEPQMREVDLIVVKETVPTCFR